MEGALSGLDEILQNVLRNSKEPILQEIRNLETNTPAQTALILKALENQTLSTKNLPKVGMSQKVTFDALQIKYSKTLQAQFEIVKKAAGTTYFRMVSRSMLKGYRSRLEKLKKNVENKSETEAVFGNATKTFLDDVAEQIDQILNRLPERANKKNNNKALKAGEQGFLVPKGRWTAKSFLKFLLIIVCLIAAAVTLQQQQVPELTLEEKQVVRAMVHTFNAAAPEAPMAVPAPVEVLPSPGGGFTNTVIVPSEERIAPGGGFTNTVIVPSEERIAPGGTNTKTHNAMRRIEKQIQKLAQVELKTDFALTSSTSLKQRKEQVNSAFERDYDTFLALTMQMINDIQFRNSELARYMMAVVLMKQPDIQSMHNILNKYVQDRETKRDIKEKMGIPDMTKLSTSKNVYHKIGEKYFPSGKLMFREKLMDILSQVREFFARQKNVVVQSLTRVKSMFSTSRESPQRLPPASRDPELP